MEQLQSEPVAQPKFYTFNRRKRKREQEREQLRRTFGTSAEQQKLQEQQLCFRFGSATLNQTELEKLK